MSLPLPWVDRIFEKLTLLYGQQFLARWRDLDLDAVKHDWSHELDGLQNAPQAIAYALQNTDADKPPTVLQFRALCQRAPAVVLERLPAPDPDPGKVAAEMAKLATMQSKMIDIGTKDHKAWAHKILRRHADGEKINHYPLRCAREAMGLPTPKPIYRRYDGADASAATVATATTAQPQAMTPAEAFFAAEEAASNAYGTSGVAGALA